MPDKFIAMILSLVGMAIMVISFQMKGKRTLLFFQSVGTLFYLFAYMFAGGGVAVPLNIVFFIRNFIFMNIDGYKKPIRVLACALLCLACIAVYIGYVVLTDLPLSAYLLSALPIIAGVFGTFAVLNKNVNRLRVLKLGESACWIAYNLRIGIAALGGLIGETLNIISIFVALIRFSKEKEKDAAQ